IAGGGMVGLTLSLALAQGGLHVCLVDPVPVSKTLSDEFDGRVSAISYSSARMLDVLGVWNALRKRAQPIRDILVTDAKIGSPASPFSLHFDHHEIGEPMGYIAENRDIRAALIERAAAAQTLAMVCPDRVHDFATG